MSGGYKVTFSNDINGDSVNEAILNDGIVLNPANAKNPGGGFNNNRPMRAKEENDARRSTLFRDLKGIQFQLIRIGKKYDLFLDKAVITDSTFYYDSPIFDIETNSEHSHPYTQPGKVPILSIASPDMKRSYNKRTWKLVLKFIAI